MAEINGYVIRSPRIRPSWDDPPSIGFNWHAISYHLNDLRPQHLSASQKTLKLGNVMPFMILQVGDEMLPNYMGI